MDKQLIDTIDALTVRAASEHLYTVISADGNEVRLVFRSSELGANGLIVVESIVEGKLVDSYTSYFDTVEDAMRSVTEDILECYRS